ncbi:hypothetical protein GDO81_011561 [Engystomops pustulosus]|uniref:Uncharacterized protein n=1 Tax=Engystomops pustulosus TaxID=76066 RepID=A0AAV7BFV6_ENGPU|nr:hypothetical protein GDO81_011561 [Engystomops pustulosus]
MEPQFTPWRSYKPLTVHTGTINSQQGLLLISQSLVLTVNRAPEHGLGREITHIPPRSTIYLPDAPSFLSILKLEINSSINLRECSALAHAHTH